MTEHVMPKAAAELHELAIKHDWASAHQFGEDSGGSPFLTLELGRKVGEGKRAVYHYRITWHTRNTGTYRLFSKICRTPASPGWHDAPSLRAIRATIEEHGA